MDVQPAFVVGLVPPNTASVVCLQYGLGQGLLFGGVACWSAVRGFDSWGREIQSVFFSKSKEKSKIHTLPAVSSLSNPSADNNTNT